MNPPKQYTYEEIFNDKKTILFFPAHPDDVIVFFGALIHKLIKDKKNVYVATVSNGNRGSRENEVGEKELAEKRQIEEKNALKHLGLPLENYFSLDQPDGEVENNLSLVEKISFYIRKLKPDLVATHEPQTIYSETYNQDGYFVHHRDHRKTGEAVIDSVYPYARNRSFFPDQSKKGLEPFSVYDVLLTDEAGSNFDFDYTNEVQTKMEALKMHASQFSENDAQEIVDSVKFGDKYLEKFKYLKLLW